MKEQNSKNYKCVPCLIIDKVFLEKRFQRSFFLQSFDYTELCHSTPIMDGNAGTIPVSVTNIQRSVVHGGGEGSPTTSISHQVTRSRPWHDFGRQSEADKVQIPKM